jgi:hypothetical protein
MKAKLPAVSLIETLLAVSLFAIIVSIPFSINSGVVYRVESESAQAQIGHAFRRAQLYAQQSRNDSSWGVYIQSNRVTVFAGNSYAARNTLYDDVLTFDIKHITIAVTSGSAEVVYTKVFAVQSASSTISVSTSGSPNKTIALSANGALTYN